MRYFVAAFAIGPVVLSCGSSSQTQLTALEERVARLEASVAALRSRPSSSPVPVTSAVPSGAHSAAAPESDSSGYEGEQTVSDWLMTGVGAPDFTVASDGDAVRIEPKGAPSQRFVALVRTMPADALVGKQVTASFLVRADGLESQGACVLKVQEERPLAYQGFLAGDFKMVAASTKGFVPCSLTATVPEGARWILFGASYRGRGKMWVKSPELNPGPPKG